MKEREHLKDLGVDGGDNIKIDLKVMGCEGMGQLIGLRTGTSGRLVCIVMVS
jgi:hypothetical protein